MSGVGYLRTGQTTCHDVNGIQIACAGSGQDAEFRAGVPWPEPRFEIDHHYNVVLDSLTGLGWMRDANPAEYPLTWREALEFIAGLNRRKMHGCDDWRLPNRRELRSLVSHQTRQPALPERHPFLNVFSGWYWTSTTAAISPAHAWYLHPEGARLFYGGKDQSFLAWPVRGAGNGVLPATGQIRCYSETGEIVPCARTGQDGEWRMGRAWPVTRFEVHGDQVSDHLTGLCWRRLAHLTYGPVTWVEALAAVAELNRGITVKNNEWRLPNINELESLVDCSAHSPALTPGHPFTEIRDVYWSSTTSLFEPDWAWALYLDKGAVGVGQKAHARFHAWAVCAGP